MPMTDGLSTRCVPGPPPPPIFPVKEHFGYVVAPRPPILSGPPPPLSPSLASPMLDDSAKRSAPPPPPSLASPMMDASTKRSTPPPSPSPSPSPSPMMDDSAKRSTRCPPSPPPRPPSPPPSSLASPMIDASAKRSTPCPPPPPLMSPGESSSVRGGPPLPPPPPLRSGQAPSSMSPPPPPPVPAVSAKDGCPPTIHAPSIPSVPPPINSSKEAPNVTTTTNKASGSSGSPSPPPPSITPPGIKGKSLLSRTLTSRNNQTKKLKPLHWLKLSRAVSGSLWAETQKSGEASKAPEIDISELESLFSAAVPNPDQGGSGRKLSSRGSMANKSEKVQLIEHRRAYNCEIMLSKVKIPLHDLQNSVLSLEDSAIDVDQVDNLIKFCPTKEEMQMLKGYTGDKDSLGKCERVCIISVLSDIDASAKDRI